MKVTFYLLTGMLCLNSMTLLLAGMGIAPTPLTPFNSTELQDAMNATEIVTSWDPSQQSFYDIGSGLLYFWNVLRYLIDGFPSLLADIGAPPLFITILRIPWTFIWLGWVISFLSGRDFMP